MKKSPWAKLMMWSTPKSSASPAATRASEEPTTRPFRSWRRTWLATRRLCRRCDRPSVDGVTLEGLGGQGRTHTEAIEELDLVSHPTPLPTLRPPVGSTTSLSNGTYFSGLAFQSLVRSNPKESTAGLAEHCGGELVWAREVCGLVGADQDAAVHGVHARAQGAQQIKGGVDDKDRHPISRGLHERVSDELDVGWHQAFGRLIDQKQLRLQGDAAREGEHLLLAAAERAGHLVAPLFENWKERV